jgi:hypothetical protein
MEHKMYGHQACEEGHMHHHPGFMMVLPFLAVPLAFGMMRGFAKHRREFIHARYGQGDENFVPPFFAELHRRAHAAEAKTPPPAEETKTTPPTVES